MFGLPRRNPGTDTQRTIRIHGYDLEVHIGPDIEIPVIPDAVHATRAVQLSQGPANGHGSRGLEFSGDRSVSCYVYCMLAKMLPDQSELAIQLIHGALVCNKVFEVFFDHFDFRLEGPDGPIANRPANKHCADAFEAHFGGLERYVFLRTGTAEADMVRLMIHNTFAAIFSTRVFTNLLDFVQKITEKDTGLANPVYRVVPVGQIVELDEDIFQTAIDNIIAPEMLKWGGEPDPDAWRKPSEDDWAAEEEEYWRVENSRKRRRA